MSMCPRVRPCRRCDCWHDSHMIVSRRSVEGVQYKGRDCHTWHHDRYQAIADQCDWQAKKVAA